MLIIGNDTDILILCLAFHDVIDCDLFIRIKDNSRVRCRDVSAIAKALGTGVCHALLGMHAFTGCDSVSAFAGRGKLNALKLVVKHQQFQETFTKLGSEWTVSTDIKKSLEDFTCRLYASKTEIADVHDLRFQLFRAKCGNIESGQLPPCRDTLELHIQRANYQTAVWRRSLINNPEIPSPVDCGGWELSPDGSLQVRWMQGSPAPDVVLEFLSCKCKKKCSLPKCECLANGLNCTSACTLQTCENQKCEEEHIEKDYETDEDSDS